MPWKTKVSRHPSNGEWLEAPRSVHQTFRVSDTHWRVTIERGVRAELWNTPDRSPRRSRMGAGSVAREALEMECTLGRPSRWSTGAQRSKVCKPALKLEANDHHISA